jgi:hypothetical protein
MYRVIGERLAASLRFRMCMAIAGAIAGLMSLGFVMPLFFLVGGSWGDALPVALVDVVLVAILAAVWGRRLETPLPAGASIVVRAVWVAFVSWVIGWGSLIALATLEAAASTAPGDDPFMRAFGQAVYGLMYVVLASPFVILVAIQLALASIVSFRVLRTFGTDQGQVAAARAP